MNQSIIIMGGGMAGLVSALHLSSRGMNVTLIEQNTFPRHKVCGEYISNEVLPYLKSLGFNPFDFGAKNITDLTLSSPKSRSIKAKLPLGGFSISRYCIDSKLVRQAAKAGTRLINAKVTDIDFHDNIFKISTNKNEVYTSNLVIGSFGKRSNLDVKLNRKFIKKSSPFLGVKAHYKGSLPDNLVGLHNFEGGYCGLSKIENDLINVCYITDYESFKKYKNIEDFQSKVMSKNKFLKSAFENFELMFDKPLTISQVSFDRKNPVENHILMCGDSAGMIHPLAGNGMGMAIRSAQIVSELILKFNSGQIKTRDKLERKYLRSWNKEFSTRLRSGHIISRLFRLGIFSELIMIVLKIFPFIIPSVISKTHGKLMKAAK